MKAPVESIIVVFIICLLAGSPVGCILISQTSTKNKAFITSPAYENRIHNVVTDYPYVPSDGIVIANRSECRHRRSHPLYSLADYVMDRKKGLGPNATRRWGRRMDRERQHSFGNVQGNEDVGGCNPEYKFAETYFDEDEEVHNWPPEEQLDHSGDLYWRFKKLNGLLFPL